MAYYTGIGTADVSALYLIIQSIAANHGYTVDDTRFTAPSGQGFTIAYDITVDAWNDSDPKPWMKLWLRSADGTLSTESRTTGLWGPFTRYHIFCDTTYLQVVVEVSPMVFAHFGYIEHEDKWGYTGGGCVYGTFWNYNTSYRTSSTSNRHSRPFDQYSYYGVSSSIVRCDIEGVSNRYFKNYNSHTNGYMCGGYPIGTQLCGENVAMSYSPNTLNGLEPLYPIVNGVKLSNKVRLIGRAPNMRIVDMTAREPGEVINYGNDEWMVFPIKKKQLSTPESTDLSSSVYGLAYKK